MFLIVIFTPGCFFSPIFRVSNNYRVYDIDYKILKLRGIIAIKKAETLLEKGGVH